jgi:hypothetical protein
MSGVFRENRGVFLFDWRGVVFCGSGLTGRVPEPMRDGVSEIREYRYFRISGKRVFLDGASGLIALF